MPGLPKLAFDPAEHVGQARIDAWIRYMGYMHKVAPIDRPGRGFAASAQSWVIDRLVFSHVFFDPQTITSTLGSSSVAGAPDILFGWYLRAGSAQVWHAGELLDIRDDAFYLFDYSQDYFSIAAKSEVISVMIPHTVIGYDPRRHPSRLALDRASADGALVVEELERIVRDGDHMTRRDMPDEAEHFTALFASLLYRHRDTAAQPPSQLEDIRDYIDARIFGRDLFIQDVMAAFQVPRGKIYEALGMSQNLDDYVTKRRLDYAFRSLAFGAPDSDRISQIAAYCHYHSRQAFSEAFEARYQLAPGSILGVVDLDAALGVSPPAQELWESWYRGER